MKDLEILNAYVNKFKETLNPKIDVKILVTLEEEYFFVRATCPNRHYAVYFKYLDEAPDALYSLFYERIYANIIGNIIDDDDLL